MGGRHALESYVDEAVSNATGGILDGSEPFTGNVEFQDGLTATTADPPTNSTPATDLPLGFSYSSTGSGAGWPTSAGAVRNYSLGDSGRTHQVFIDQAGPNMYFRRWVSSTSSWTAWKEVATV